ncbi:MAG: hypothetical protein V1866_03560 [archaeon]
MDDFMGKKVNMFLLLMIILVLAGLGGVSIYYQHTFKTVNQNFNNASSTLASCQQTLEQTTGTLMSTVKNLNSTESDIRKYDTLYEQKAGELEAKKQDLANTQADLNRITVLKESYKRQLDDYYTKILVLNVTITKLNQNVSSLKNELNSWKDIASCLRNADSESEKIACY